MKLWVTGASSFVGRALTQLCRERGIEVFGTDLVGADDPSIHVVDVRAPELGECVPTDIDAAVHLAAISSDPACRQDPIRAFDVNVSGSLNVLEAARKRGIRQLIFASSEWVYDHHSSDRARLEGDPIDPLGLSSEYALSKLTAEAALRQARARHDIAVTVLRFGILYGPRRGSGSAVETLVERSLSGEPVEIGSRATARGFVHVEDAVRSILAAVGRGGFEIYNIQPEHPITLGDILSCIGELLGRSIPVIETTPATPSIRNVSGALARQQLGWTPTVSLFDGIRDIARLHGVRDPRPLHVRKTRELET